MFKSAVSGMYPEIFQIHEKSEPDEESETVPEETKTRLPENCTGYFFTNSKAVHQCSFSEWKKLVDESPEVMDRIRKTAE